jgi:signal transduction histidine kinase/CheY-like chemotaxis protein
VTDPGTSIASDTLPAIIPAPFAAKRWALGAGATLSAAFCALIPFARVPLPRIEAFVPIYAATFAFVCLMTAGFLIFGFRRSRLRVVLVLASGYLFTSLIVVSQVLTHPGVFSQNGLLGAGPQSSAWLDLFRRAGLPLFVIGYALAKWGDGVGGRCFAGIRAKVVTAIAGVAAGVCLLTLLVTTGDRVLPPIVDGTDYTSAMLPIDLAVCFFGLAALVVLGSRRPYSILDLWLLVVLFTGILGTALAGAVNTGPFDIGFYSGRLFDLFAAGVVPAVLLVEASRIAGRLDEAIALAEERNAALVRSREELARAQRLEAIGQLTGGIAHDFNNLLTIVIGNLDLIFGARGDTERIERLAQSAMKAAHRGAHLVRQLLTYARRQLGQPQTVDLNQVIANLGNLIRRVIGEQIEVITTLSPQLAPVQIDPAQFETAILNLVINSRDAIAGAGRITIETRNVIVEPRHAAEDPEATPGPHVVVVVGDSGAGMTPTVLARAFDPFFTTKEIGRGSGLGLSQVYGFTKTAGGHVEIRSELGIGTTVELYLPKSAAVPVPPEPEGAIVSLPMAGGHETILVVEDDEDVLAVTAECLQEFGYHVVTAGDAAHALEILRGDQRVDLMFSDVIIPGGTNGAQLAVESRRVRPALKVLLTSGYTAAALSLEHGLPADLEVVDKPYQREELARKLRAAIAG